MDDIIVTPLESASRSSDCASSTDAARFILFTNELPSGDVEDLLRRLHNHAKLPRFSHLARFLHQSTVVLKEQVQKLPRPLRDLVPPFHNVMTLASRWEELKESPLRGAWEGAFVCIYEMGMLIGYHEAHGIPYHNGSSQLSAASCVAGISVGLFAAAAAATSCSLNDLVVYGAEGVRVSFAFCVHVGRVSQLLEDTARPDEAVTSSSWAHVVIGVSAQDVQAELDRFNGPESLTRISISHVDRASVGVTGPPQRLVELFRQSKLLAASRHSPLPIYGGLCHVGNVYNSDDVATILSEANVGQGWGTRPLQLPLLSPFSGTPFSAHHGHDLIKAICTEALTKPLYFDKLSGGVVGEAAGKMMESYDIFHYRTSLVSDNIIAGVRANISCSTVRQQDLVEWAMQDANSLEQLYGRPSLPQNAKLAVVGMACRMPGGADTPEQFWELLMDGVDTHTIIPAERFDVETHYDATDEKDNTVGTKFGNFISNPGHFDAGFFNMSPREAEQTDPMQRLALVTAYEALEMAGFVPNRTPSSHASRVGTYYGQASDDYREVNASQKIGTYGIPGTERAFGNGRINYFFKFQGPSFNVDTACSSGLAAVQAACSALWAGEADTVIAGGLNVITNPDIYCMLSKGHFLSKTGQCKVWDAQADGYCRGDGVGSVVIKRLDDALADNDVVLATIVAGASNHSAESISITQPHAGAQKDNYRQVMGQAGVSPLDVGFVELHGTGTQVGDAVESESVVNFFAPTGRRLAPSQRLNLGAVKSNIGHGEAAAGIASLIKVLLMYRHNMIPRHIGISTTINPVVARTLANRNAGVLAENSPWLPMSDASSKRYSIVNSFGAHGGNTTLLLEDGPRPFAHALQECNGQVSHVVCVSAKSKASLRGNLNALLRHLSSYPDTRLQDLAYTTSARRIHHHIRIAASVGSTAQLREFLQTAVDNVDAHAKHVATSTHRPVVFVFSGQGGFYRGCGAQLYEHAPLFRQQVLQLDRVVRQLGFPSVLTSIAGDAASEALDCSSSDSGTDCATEASLDHCSSFGDGESPLVTQLALLVLQIALVQYWAMLGIKPGLVLGHSLGEYAALVTAGVLSVADALLLVGRRASLMLAACEAGSHAMLSVRGESAEGIAKLCDEHTGRRFDYQVSCINGRSDIVVSGRKSELEALQEMLQKAGLKCMLLDVPFAFHSAQLDPILQEYEAVARHTTFKTPSIPVVSPLLGQCVSTGEIFNARYLQRATREPVDFVAALDAALEEGLVNDKAAWIDIGPHPVATSFARNHYGSATTQTFASLRRNDDSLTALTTSLAALHCMGMPVGWNEYFAAREKTHRLLHLDPYQWNQKNYWLAYNGTWTLDKANPEPAKSPASAPASSFSTSSVQRVLSEEITETGGHMTALSSLAHPDLRGAADGHQIHGRSVVTGSIWADITRTVGEYLYKRAVPGTDEIYMNVRDMTVLEAQIIHQDPAQAAMQFIQIQAVLDLAAQQTQVSLFTADASGLCKSEKAFATAVVCYEDAQTWQAEWQTAAHLIASRSDSLWHAASAESSSVSRFSQSVAYHLFANVVDYGPQYRGMQRVALAEETQEATADIVLSNDRHGTWHTPPHWIDSTFQLAGFVMNSFGVQGDGDAAGSSRDFFYITPGWRQFRLAKPLQPGPETAYRNYVRMFPVPGEPGAYAGDIYLLSGQQVVGLCAGIKFKRVPRALMPIMFPVQRQANKGQNARQPLPKTEATPHVEAKPAAAVATEAEKPKPRPVAAAPPAEKAAAPAPVQQEQGGQNPRVAACLQLIAEETGLDLDDLAGEAAFADLGVDSLMSLALSGKIRAELGLDVQASIFLECPTVKDLVAWLSK
ncbi:hypothetical protein CDD81_590 [Ophiocordyceps australis]|uniref:Uncharacterized protein n=1 Tax=Ophiocordyceps australis TaxID=1399860 RepID=A0A2C5Y9A1_9HYPO|nr:hypothetical protein CDD81_590 [Ophiocordyceps australis]